VPQPHGIRDHTHDAEDVISPERIEHHDVHPLAESAERVTYRASRLSAHPEIHALTRQVRAGRGLGRRGRHVHERDHGSIRTIG
jgi:hypothetical protein